jgi:hypothetical protein
MLETMLLMSALLLPVIYAGVRSLDAGRVRIDHVTLFSVGFVFYWVAPIAAGLVLSTEVMPAMWTELFDARVVVPYLAAIIATYLSFIAGDQFGVWAFRRQKSATDGKNARRSLSPHLLAALSGAAFFLFLVEVLLHRAELFVPYSADVNELGARGQATAWVVLLGSIVLLRLSSRPRFTRLLLPFAAACLFMVWTGSRLYTASFVLMFAVFRSLYVRPFGRRQTLAAGLAMVALFGALGALRENMAIADAGRNVLLETVFTSLSLVYFLRYEHMAWLAVPKYLASDFYNLIPSFILPGKASLIEAPYYFSPVGALHSFVSFNFNFGLVGTAAFMFLLPVGLRWARARDASPLYRTMYVMLSGWLAFTFFRDGFSVSIVKTMFEHSMVLPAAIVAMVRLVEIACLGLPLAEAGARA